MQTPKSRNSSSVSTPRKSSPRSISSESSPKNSSEASKKVSARVVRELKATSSPSTVSKLSDHRSPKTKAFQANSPSRVSELESQVSQLERDLKAVRNQLLDAEASKKRAEKVAEEANQQVLVALSSKFEESQKFFYEKLALPEISQEQDQSAELFELSQMLSETFSLLKDMKDQFRDSKESEHRMVDETLMHLANAKKIVDMLRSNGLLPKGVYDAVVSELEKSRARNDYLEGLVGELEAKMSVEATEKRCAEEQARNAEDVRRKAFETVEKIKSESGQRVAELESELKRSKYAIEELKANLMDKETELQGICEENEGLTTKLEKSASGQRERELEKELEKLKALLLERETELQKSQINAAHLVSDEESMKVGYLMEEIDESNKKMGRIAEQLEAAQSVNADMEAEMRRLKVQSLQWRKAAEAAAAMITERKDNCHSPNSKKTNLLYGEQLDGDVLTKKNANGLRRFWKKPHK